MEESVKIAVRWQPIPENDERRDEIILKKLSKNVSVVPCTVYGIVWNTKVLSVLVTNLIFFFVGLGDWR